MHELAAPCDELAQQRGLYERRELGAESKLDELPGQR